VLDYLARYVFRVATTNTRIVGLDDEAVAIRHKHRKSNRWRITRIPGQEFMRRFLQHVLPKGLHKVRYFGLWHPAKRKDAARARLLLLLDRQTTQPRGRIGADAADPSANPKTSDDPRVCPCCRKGLLERFPAGLNRAVFPTRWKCDSWGAPNRRRRGMGPLSVDLRKRVVSAVREEGMSCRAAAQRFGVSFSSAIRWVAALRERGSYAPLPMGGDTRSQRVEAHTDFLLRLHRREPDLTLNEICDRLERARGEKVSPSMIWRFFDRHDITFKKSPRTRVSRAARTSLSGDGDGSTVNSISIR